MCKDLGNGTAWGGRRTCNADISGGFKSLILHHLKVRLNSAPPMINNNRGEDNEPSL